MLKSFHLETVKKKSEIFAKFIADCLVKEFSKKRGLIMKYFKNLQEIKFLKDKILIDLNPQIEDLYSRNVNHEAELKILFDENIKVRFISILNNNFEKRKSGLSQSSFKDNLAARNFTNAFISDIQYNLRFMNKKVNAKKVKNEIENIIDGYFDEWSKSKN